jgi:hypothetical protein
MDAGIGIRLFKLALRAYHFRLAAKTKVEISCIILSSVALKKNWCFVNNCFIM